jgi:CheY-like chemotaxis protein
MPSWRRDDLIQALPYVRRYARALTGSQQAGDSLVAESLKEMLSDEDANANGELAVRANPRLVLYEKVTRRFDRGRAGSPKPPGALSPKQRRLLLLTHLEELAINDAAAIVGLDRAEASEQLNQAREHLRGTAATGVLIIEDEPIIAMDIEELVRSCGHQVVGVAATEAEAVRIASRTKPGLILADINLGAGGDGTNAVARILKRHAVPVIFVTAYPERLLTGEAVEPAFVITKPFDPMALAIATYQAVTGGLHLD